MTQREANGSASIVTTGLCVAALMVATVYLDHKSQQPKLPTVCWYSGEPK